jgi:hypothetical protein
MAAGRRRPIPLRLIAGDPMTTDPDAVSKPRDATDAGGSTAGRDEPARAGRGRSAKLMPPADPIGTLARPAL